MIRWNLYFPSYAAYMTEIGAIRKVSLSLGLGLYPTDTIHRLVKKDLTQSAMTGSLGAVRLISGLGL